MTFNGYLFCAASVFALAGCSTLGQAQKNNSLRAVTIELKAKSGAHFDTRFYSHAYIRTYADQQLVREKHEAVDFTTRTSIEDSRDKVLRYKMSTYIKDGAASLHELAFPELNETIEYIVRANGEVLKAGAYPPDSLFFVPALPIPKTAVQVGDTWVMEHSWLSANEGIPLRLEIVGILKNLVSCEGTKTCADIEVSGSVKLGVPPTAVGAKFGSRIWGRMLFGLERGDVIWSEVRSEEEMATKGERILIQSCMVSEIKTAEKYKTKLNCEPGEIAVTSVPKL